MSEIAKQNGTTRKRNKSFVSSYISTPVTLGNLEELFSAARNTSCIFSVIQDPALLLKLSAQIAECLNKNISPCLSDYYKDSGSDLFDRTGILLTIYSQSNHEQAIKNALSAEEKIASAAPLLGLKTSVTSFAIPLLNTPEWKQRLDVPEAAKAVAPLTIKKIK